MTTIDPDSYIAGYLAGFNRAHDNYTEERHGPFWDVTDDQILPMAQQELEQTRQPNNLA